MRDVTVELKQLRLHGMAGAWTDLIEQGTNASLDGSRWLIEHLMAAVTTDPVRQRRRGGEPWRHRPIHDLLRADQLDIDILTFGVMWWVFNANTVANQRLFQSGWFVVGLLTQTLVVP